MDYSEVLSVFRTPLARPGLGISTELAAPFQNNNLAPRPRLNPLPNQLRLKPLPKSEFQAVTESRRERFSLQTTGQVVTGQLAQGLNPAVGTKVISDRVTYCATQLEGKGLIKRYGSDQGQRRGRAKFSGLHVCGNQWLCPMCSQIIGEFRADEARQAIAWAKSQGLVVELHTVTLRHGVDDELKDLMEGMAAAWREFMAHKTMKNLKKRHGYVGYIRGFEVTRGFNGWHPHYHFLFFSETSWADQRIRLAELWQGFVTAQGLPEPSVLHGYDVRDGTEAGTYLNKFADDSHLEDGSPEMVLTSRGDAVRWDAVDELSKWHAKKGRNENSLTPFDFLRKLRFAYVSGLTDQVPLFKGLWREYALATRGKPRLQWSKFFKQKVGIEELKDAEVIEVLDEKARDVVSVIPEELWPAVFRRGSHDNRSKVLEVAEEMGSVGVAWWLWSDYNRRGQPMGSWESFLSYMFSEIQAYQDDTDAALRVHWQAVMPVNVYSVLHNEKLHKQMKNPLRYMKKR